MRGASGGRRCSCGRGRWREVVRTDLQEFALEEIFRLVCYSRNSRTVGGPTPSLRLRLRIFLVRFKTVSCITCQFEDSQLNHMSGLVLTF